MDRVVEYDKEKELFAMATMIFSIPADLAKSVDGFVVFPGLGESWRVKEALDWWNSKIDARFLLIPGMNLRERTATAFDNQKIQQMSKDKSWRYREKKVIVRAHAEHTKDQADWTMEQVKTFHIGDIALFVSPFHMVRAYLTLLKSALQKKLNIFIVPVPVPVAPHVIIPETGIDAWGMIPGEVERIKIYQEKGDVATFEELKDYLASFNSVMYK